MLLKNRMFSLLLVVSQVTGVGYAHADIAAGLSASAALTGQASYGLAGGGALGGSGYWGGTQACPYATRTSKAAVDVSDEEKRERTAIKKLQKDVELETLKRDRAEKKLELMAKKLEKFFEPEVYDFLVTVHMDKLLKCEEYRTFPGNGCPVPGKPGVTSAPVDASRNEVSKEVISKCDGLDEVPPLLKDKWTKADGTGGYCAANTSSSRGNVNAAICSDKTLQPSDAPKYRKLSATDCSRALSEYRKTRMEYDKAQSLVERKQEEVDERTEAVADARELAKLEREYNMRNKLEGSTDCEECNQKPQRDWWSTIANVAGGLGLAWYGKKIDESAQEYNAQLGFPSTNSYGYPFVTAGVYSVINGLAGPGAYGCAGGVGGSGFPYGGGGASGPYGTNGYGPFSALGGAFGYPQNLYGSPWGGGAYNPGVGFNGSLNGPNGGWPYGLNGQFGVGVPVNGQIGIPANGGWQQQQVACFTWPCNVGTAVGGAIGGVVNGQIGVPANGGWQTTGYMANGYMSNGYMSNGYMSNGYMSNGAMNNYQLQMMQQQQAMLQAQAQQQAQMAQYYQAQQQQQMIAYQRQQAAQQEAMQVQQVISSLQARLNMIMQGAYGSGTSYYGGGGSLYGGGTGYLGGGVGGAIGGIVSGGIYFGAASATLPGTTYPIGTATTVLPGTGTGTRGR